MRAQIGTATWEECLLLYHGTCLSCQSGPRRRCWAEPDQKGRKRASPCRKLITEPCTQQHWVVKFNTHQSLSTHSPCMQFKLDLFIFFFFFFFLHSGTLFPTSCKMTAKGNDFIYIFIYLLRIITPGNVSSIFNRIWVVLDYSPPPPPLTVSDHSSYNQSVHVIFLSSFWLLRRALIDLLWHLSPRYTAAVLWPRQSARARRGWERDWRRTKPRTALWIIEGGREGDKK